MDNQQPLETYEAPRLRPLGSLHELTQGGPSPFGMPNGGDHFGHWHRGSF
jgi:hypothetical protein